MFLASGGFPGQPAAGHGRVRIAIEDLKSRFAACAWRDPIDPDHVLGGVSGTAATEWQQEIASQTTQRNQILNASKDATSPWRPAPKRWVTCWGTRGSPTTSRAGRTTGPRAGPAGSATPGGDRGARRAGQVPRRRGREEGQRHPRPLSRATVRRRRSGRSTATTGDCTCETLELPEVPGRFERQPGQRHEDPDLDVQRLPARGGEYNLRATGSLRNVGTDKCLDLHEYTNGYRGCTRATAAGRSSSTSRPPDTPAPCRPKPIDKAKPSIAAAQTAAKKQLDVLKTQLAAVKKAATTSDTTEQASYTIADTSSTPRGRGILVGQQKAQVTQGAAAALEAMVKAGETARGRHPRLRREQPDHRGARARAGAGEGGVQEGRGEGRVAGQGRGRPRRCTGTTPRRTRRPPRPSWPEAVKAEAG